MKRQPVVVVKSSRKGRGRDKDKSLNDLLIFQLIEKVSLALRELLNFIDRSKSQAKCGENIYYYCADVQSALELIIQKSTCQAQTIISFITTSKQYQKELTESHNSLLRFNNKGLGVAFSASSTSSSSMTATPSYYHNGYVPRDPNSVFNTIQVDLESIPMDNINESITSRPKTYIYHNLMKEMEETIVFNKNQPSPFASKIRESLDHYKDIVESNELNTNLMHDFIIDYKKIENFPNVNDTSNINIITKLNTLKRVFFSQINSSSNDKLEIETSNDQMTLECDNISESVVQVNNLIALQQKSTDDYMKNTVIYWNKLNSFHDTMIVKIYNQLQKLLSLPSAKTMISINESTVKGDSSSSSKPRLATMF
jgi:hypothetical protein